MTGLPTPEHEYGYPASQLEEVLGSWDFADFLFFMQGETPLLGRGGEPIYGRGCVEEFLAKRKELEWVE